MLVATCPCALALATPVAITTTTGVLSRLGLLLTRGQAIENLAHASVVCLDKTGTLTVGQPDLVEVQVLDPALDRAGLLRLVAALERHSEHPAAKALVRAAGIEPPPASAVRNHPGRGIGGEVEGRRLRIGSAEFVAATAAAEGLQGPTDQVQRTPVYVAADGRLLGVCWLADQPRPAARETIAALRELGLEPVLLSGDQPAATAAFARVMGIETALGGLSPEDKLRYVRERQARGQVVLMAGEGINDAPVLAGADVSLAMGSGTRIAQTQADLILMSDRLAALPEAVRQARWTLRIVRQNIAWAIGYNAVALPVAATGLLTPWLAALGMSLSSLLVVGNALRLRGLLKSSPRPAAPRDAG
jgi:Cu2+-exporting ATPase